VDGPCEDGNELSGSIKCWKILEPGSFSRRAQLNGDCQPSIY
jgi:hypothetical protein